MNKALALKALQSLDEKLANSSLPKITLTVGGGGAMILKHDYSGATVDIDAVPSNIDFEELKPFMEKVAKELKIAPDWLNPYYQAFTVYLPKDSKNRMSDIYVGNKLLVKSLGPEEILIMKLMAGRAKDMAHIKHLLKMKIDLSIVENRLEELTALFPKIAKKALDLLDDLTESE
ncbi:MAG: DUF6036 family nucleotidyltransferase [Pseudobdellovibrionaceae bacterium]